MKVYHIFFVILRLLVAIQVVLVVFKKKSFSPSIKVIIDSVLKLSLGLFIIIFFYFHNVGLDPWDIYVLQFSGILIIVDIDYASLLDVIGKVSPSISKNLEILKTIQRYPKSQN
uniref:Uncharacterized protein n=1 Tax=viral metagenome TaxID=1070528 RepID=A0A6C0ANT3_9ZZZZ